MGVAFIPYWAEMSPYHRDCTYLERECALRPFWQKKWQLQQARVFYKMAEFVFIFIPQI